MRILKVHNAYQLQGGEEITTAAEIDLLRRFGHEVVYYQDTNDRLADLNSVQMALQTVWSSSSYRLLRQYLHQQRIDIVHVHNFFPLISPAVYYAAQAAGVPVVQTLHNYRLLCPNALFFRQQQVCEACLGQLPWPGVWHGCYRDSRAASAVVATMVTTHRWLQTWTHQVDSYITMTEFARQKFIAGGLPGDRIVVKPHFVDPDPGVGTGQGGYALYVGRLSSEKGLDTLLAAWEQLPAIPLKIIGDGPMAAVVRQRVNQWSHIDWLGPRSIAEVYDWMGQAAVVIMPSRWYETFGRVIIEAFAKGTPAIAADLGVMAELITPQVTGLLFQAGDVADLIRQATAFFTNPARQLAMRQAARQEYETLYRADRNYAQLMSLYQRLQRSKPIARTPDATPRSSDPPFGG